MKRRGRVIHITPGCNAARTAARGEGSSERGLCERCVTRQVLRTCSSAGLPRHDAEDVTQDIWLWLIRNGPPDQFTKSWLHAVTRNFLLRYWRQRLRKEVRHDSLAEEDPSVPDTSACERVELGLSLDRIARTLPRREQQLLALLRKGHSFSDAADLVGVPKGSRHSCRSRLVESMERGSVGGR